LGKCKLHTTNTGPPTNLVQHEHCTFVFILDSEDDILAKKSLKKRRKHRIATIKNINDNKCSQGCGEK
jgi:hypothetical protein